VLHSTAINKHFIKVHLDRLSYHWKQKALWGRREKYTTIMSTFMLTGTY